MEAIDGKMINYTKEEIEQLTPTFVEIGNSTANKVFIALNEYDRIEYSKLISIVYNPENVDIDQLDELGNRILELIYYEPLENVPLFINVFPDIAKWRLQIGK